MNYTGTNITQDDILSAIREAMADQSKWNYIDPNGDMMAEYRNDKGIRIGRQYGDDGSTSGYFLQFNKGAEADPGDYRYYQRLDASGNPLGDVSEMNFENKNTYLRDLATLAAVTTGANWLAGGGLLGGSGGAAAGEASGGSLLGGGEVAGGGLKAGGSYGTINGTLGGGLTVGETAGLAGGTGVTGSGVIGQNIGGTIPLTGVDPKVLADTVSTGGKVVDTKKTLTDTVSDVAKTVGNGMDINDIIKLVTAVGGAAAGYAGSKDQTSTSEREPWKEAQPWLKDLISQGQVLQRQYAANPFNQTQRDAMDESLRLIKGFSGLIPAAYQSVASRPEFRRGGAMSANRGLLDVSPSAQFESSTPRQPSAFPSQIAGGQFSNTGGRPARLTPEQIKLINESGAAGWTF